MNRRHVHAVALVVVVAVFAAGCIGAPDDDDPPIRATAGTATLTDEARTTTGYQVVRETSEWLNVTVFAEIQGDVSLQTERQVNATVSVAEYRRTTQHGPAVFALYTAPGIQPFDQANLTKNPAAALAKQARLTRAQTTYAEFGEFNEQGTRSVTLLGNETTLTTYATTATHDGTKTEVTVRSATVATHGDYVTVVFVTPKGASQPVASLLDGVTYEKKALS